jgi:hypothetical protein
VFAAAKPGHVLIEVLTTEEAPPVALDRIVFQQHVIVIDDVVEDCRVNYAERHSTPCTLACGTHPNPGP